MKKILFATTALIATAGVAAADVTFGGYGRFGLRYDDSADKETFLESRFRMNVDVSAETDGGVRFSARVRIQSDDNGDNTADNAGINAPRFSVEFEGLRVDVGNAAGAIDNLPNYFGFEPGLSNFIGHYSGVDYDFTGYASQSGCDAASDFTVTSGTGTTATTGTSTFDPPICVDDSEDQTVYARYAVGAFAVAASYTDNADERYDLHFAYSGDNWTGALAYGSNNEDQDIVVATGNIDLGAINATLFLGTEDLNDDATDGTFYGVSAEYELGAATTIGFSYGDGEADNDTEQYGIGFIHDLGGGVTIR
ncbi:MAG: porin, partial [Pseudomonadota bacterium]